MFTRQNSLFLFPHSYFNYKAIYFCTAVYSFYACAASAAFDHLKHSAVASKADLEIFIWRLYACLFVCTRDRSTKRESPVLFILGDEDLDAVNDMVVRHLVPDRSQRPLWRDQSQITGFARV